MLKRPWLILFLGILAAGVAYGTFYLGLSATTRLAPAGQPEELTWLKREFALNDAEFDRIARLHGAYLPQCRAMCGQVEALNQRLKQLLAQTNHVTPEIETILAEAARTRVQCQVMMLNHFYAVSRAMPPAQGKRYLEWMQTQTLLPTYHSPEPALAAPVAHEHHGH